MARTFKRWTSLQPSRRALMAGAGAASVLFVSACGGEGEAEGEGTTSAAGKTDMSGTAISGGEGEGEAEGEGEGVSTDDPGTDDIAYLHLLGQVRGHLVAFVELHRLGAMEMSATHAKHPDSELYGQLRPAFETRALPGFADELDALMDAVDINGDVEAAYQRTLSAIRQHEPETANVATWLQATSKLARTAGDEFKIGVDADGSVVNAHEYQDAYGFLTAARDRLIAIDGTSDSEREALKASIEQLDIALAEFSTLTATTVEGRSAPIYGAAARIELEALGLQE